MKKIVFTVVCIIAIIAGISIEKEKKNNIDNNSIDYITYNMTINPSELNMTTNDNIREKDLLVTLFEGLVKENEKGELVPALAEEIIVSDDGLEYNFKLRDDIYYSTREKITAEDYKNFFKAFLSDGDNIYASELDCIFGAKGFREGSEEFSNVAIAVKEDNVLSIRLNYRVPNFQDILSNPVFYLRDYGYLENYKDNYEDIRFTGPFCIEEANNKEIILKKNDNYYGKSQITSENLRVTFIESIETSLAIFESNDENIIEEGVGNIDIMMDTPINELYRLSQESKIEGFNGSSIYYLNFGNLEDNFGSNLNFRKGVNLILSKEYYSQLICKELLTPATSHLPEEQETIKVFSTFGDIEEAKVYFKEIDTNEDSIVKIAYVKDSLNKRIAEDLRKDIKEYMKVDVVCEEYDMGEMNKAIENNSYDLVIKKYSFNYREPTEFYESFSGMMYSNDANYKNENYEALIEEGKNETDSMKKNKIYAECEEILKSTFISIPMYSVNNVVCVKNNIKGVYATTDGNIILSKVKKQQ